MTLLRDTDVGAMAFRCDTCGETHGDYNLDQFDTAVQGAKQEGWVFVPDHNADDGWAHYCGRVCRQRALLGG